MLLYLIFFCINYLCNKKYIFIYLIFSQWQSFLEHMAWKFSSIQEKLWINNFIYLFSVAMTVMFYWTQEIEILYCKIVFAKAWFFCIHYCYFILDILFYQLHFFKYNRNSAVLKIAFFCGTVYWFFLCVHKLYSEHANKANWRIKSSKFLNCLEVEWLTKAVSLWQTKKSAHNWHIVALSKNFIRRLNQG